MCAQAVIQDKQGTVSKQLFPFLDLKAQFVGIREETIAAVLRVLESQHFILGPEVQAFEKEFAHEINCSIGI
jgi:dTDP-4-amino-4,6-dideoxygalactose transaminase